MDFDLDKEKQLQTEAKSELIKMKREFETIKKSKPRNAMEKDKRQKDLEFLNDEISGTQETLRLIQDNIDLTEIYQPVPFSSCIPQILWI